MNFLPTFSKYLIHFISIVPASSFEVLFSYCRVVDFNEIVSSRVILAALDCVELLYQLIFIWPESNIVKFVAFFVLLEIF